MELQTTNLLFVPSEDPTALGRRLAEAAKRAPMVFETGLGMPMLLRKPHITAVFRDPATFSTRMFQTGFLAGGLASLQGEDHARMRQIYNAFFLPRAVERYEQKYVRPIAEELVAELTGREHVDLLDAFAMELPRRVISRLFGFPMAQIRESDERAKTMMRGVVRAGDPVAAADAQRAYEATLDQITEVVERERAEHSDSLLGEILCTLEAENMATLPTCQQIVLSLLLGGYETTSWLLANVLHALLVHPSVLEQVRSDRALLPAAIEEGIRWCPSSVGTLRLVERDTTLDDLELRAGSLVYLAGIAIHYDEALYGEPERFDIGRKPTPTAMVFGGGPHYCVGAPLGRMEARVGLEVLLERCPKLRADADAKPVFSYGVRESVAHGPDQLPVWLD